MIEPRSIRWLSGGRHEGIRCAVCGCQEPLSEVLEVPSMAPPHQLLTLSRCPRCSSLSYDPPDIRDFSDLDQKREDFWRFYVEQGAGIWETVWPLLVDQAPGPRSLLDVGCGFGFTLDFWRRRHCGEARGIELADYGRLGAEMLGVPISHEFLQDTPDLQGRRFDVVYASEVVEHVPDPQAFVELLSRWVADDGLLVLTTPNANYIDPSFASTTQLAALAPGFHGFLLSPQAFAKLARDAGFAHVEVREYGERQLLWASRTPHRLDFAMPGARQEYLAYLAERFDLPDDDTPLWQGFTYRYVRDLLNAGQTAAAARAAARLEAALTRKYGVEVLDPAQTVPRLAAVESLSEAGLIGPFFLPCLYFFLGSIAQHAHGDRARARRLYMGSVAATNALARLGSLFHLEAISLVWPARMAEAELRLWDGDFAGAADAAEAMARHGLHMAADNTSALATPTLVEGYVPRFAEALAASGQRDLALRVADAYRAYVEQQYGSALLTATGIEEAFATRQGPADPLFPLWFEGLADSWRGEAAAKASPALAAAARIAAAHTADARLGARCRDIAARARRLTGETPPPKVSFDFSYTFKAPKA